MSQGWLWFEKEKVGEEKTKTWVSSVRSQPKSKNKRLFQTMVYTDTMHIKSDLKG